MNDANPRQQIVDSIKNNNNILVTVSTNPSVDELAAALGLTILLNNLGKRGTAVVSGTIPPAIDFLDPDKTFENTTDSLRDFIIALDKEKADHLRYKVEGDVVKIFITPYRTQLGEKDLEFSLGDYNVEVVIALGVKDQDHLDKALDAHGAILHDATVVTLTAGEEASSLGGVNWQDQSASSLCEMLVSLSEALKEDKPLLDTQTATAFLTGIVSATDRFSNDHTSSRVMTMAAQLMAAGANQQLIAAKLQEAHEIGPDAQPTNMVIPPPPNTDGTMSLSDGGEPTKLNKDRKKSKKAKKPEDGLLIEIDHPEEPEKPAEEPAPEAEDVVADAVAAAEPQETAEQQLARELAEVVPPAPEQEPAESLGDELAKAASETEAQPEQEQTPPEPPTEEPAPELPSLDFEALMPPTEPPTPAVPAPEPELPTSDDIQSRSNGTYLEDTSSEDTDTTDQSGEDGKPVDPFAQPLVSPNLPPLQPDPLFEAQHTATAPVGQTITPPHAPDEIEYEESPIPNDPAAVAAVPDFAAMNPTGLAAAPPPPAPPADDQTSDASQTAQLPSLDNLPPLPPLPPLPDLSATTPPPPDLSLPSSDAPAAPPPPPAPGTPPPPGQFKIPGQ